MTVQRTKRKPRPWFRAILGFLAAAITAGIGAFYVFSRPNLPAIQWYHVALGALAAIALGLGNGAPLFWAAKKELAEAQRADDEEARSNKAIKRRNDILTAVEVLADALSELFSVEPSSQQGYLWRFRQGVVDAAGRITRNLQDLDDADVRVILIEYDKPASAPVADLSLKVMTVTGRLAPLDMNMDEDSDFVKGMRRFLEDASSSPFLLIHKAETQRDKSRLRLSDQADYSMRVRIASGSDIYGALCVDSWGGSTLTEDVAHPPILAVAKLLAVGIKGCSGGPP